MDCVVCMRPTPADLLLNDEGYCTFHYRVHPESLLRKPWETRPSQGIDAALKV